MFTKTGEQSPKVKTLFAKWNSSVSYQDSFYEFVRQELNRKSGREVVPILRGFGACTSVLSEALATLWVAGHTTRKWKNVNDLLTKPGQTFLDLLEEERKNNKLPKMIENQILWLERRHKNRRKKGSGKKKDAQEKEESCSDSDSEDDDAEVEEQAEAAGMCVTYQNLHEMQANMEDPFEGIETRDPAECISVTDWIDNLPPDQWSNEDKEILTSVLRKDDMKSFQEKLRMEDERLKKAQLDQSKESVAQSFDPNLDLSTLLELISMQPNEEQMIIISKIWMHIKKMLSSQHQQTPEPPPLRMIVQGRGGCGKSYVLSTVTKMVEHLFGARTVLNGAPTGAAARLLDHGQTLHSLFPFSNSKKELSLKQRSAMQARFKHVKVLQVDERSMVSLEFLGFMNACLRDLGKVIPIVILYGDVMQLPPVRAKEIFCNQLHDETKPDEFIGSLAYAACKINTFVLDRNVRAKSAGAEWIDFVSRVRLGKVSGKRDHAYLDRLSNETTERGLRQGTSRPLYIYERKEDVHAKNLSCLKSLPEGSRFKYSSEDTRHPCGCRAERQVPTEFVGSAGIPATLCKNIYKHVGLFNGTSGTVLGCCSWGLLCEIPSYTGPALIPSHPKVCPIFYEEELCSTCHIASGCKRTGIPLLVGFASNVHKLQGTTIGQGCFYDGAYICLEKTESKLEQVNGAMMYTALSRVKSPTDMVLRHVDGNRVDQLRKSSATKRRLEELEDLERASINTMQRHLEDLKEDGSNAFATVIKCIEGKLEKLESSAVVSPTQERTAVGTRITAPKQSNKAVGTSITAPKRRIGDAFGYVSNFEVEDYCNLLNRQYQKEVDPYFMSPHFFQILKSNGPDKVGYFQAGRADNPCQRSVAQKVVIPILLGENDSESVGHWTCALIDSRAQTITYYNSLNNTTQDAVDLLLSWYSHVFGLTGTWKRSFPRNIPQQVNGIDCGVYMLQFFNLMAEGRTINESSFDSNDIAQFREDFFSNIQAYKAYKS